MKYRLSILLVFLGLVCLTACTFNPNAIPLQTFVYRELSPGVYTGTDQNTKYELVIEPSVHDYTTSSNLKLKLYRKISYGSSFEWAKDPYVTYEGEYKHYFTETNDISDEWYEEYHTDEFDFISSSNEIDFPCDEMDGLVAIRYDHKTAGKEEADSSFGQAFFPRIGTIVKFTSVPYEKFPQFLKSVLKFEMIQKY